MMPILSNLAMMLVQPILACSGFLAPDAAAPRDAARTCISASAFSMMIGAPIWGRVADRWARERF